MCSVVMFKVLVNFKCQLIMYYIGFLVFYVNYKGMGRTSQSWRPTETQFTMVTNMLPYSPCRNN